MGEDLELEPENPFFNFKLWKASTFNTEAVAKNKTELLNNLDFQKLRKTSF